MEINSHHGDERIEKVLSESANAVSTIEEPGSNTVSLEVKDPKGASDVATYPVIVGNARPEVKFLSPKDGDLFTPGEKITYSLRIDDIEDGTSDFENADSRNLETIELSAPSRTFLQVSPLTTTTRRFAPRTAIRQRVPQSFLSNSHIELARYALTTHPFASPLDDLIQRST